MLKYQQVAWQTVKTVATNDGDSSPATGIAGTITATVGEFPSGGAESSFPPEEPKSDANYVVELAPYEIIGYTSFAVSWATTTPAVTLTPSQENITLVDPATLSTENQYCEIYDVYTHFGSENVNKWADKNDRRNIEEITNAIIDEIVRASSMIDSLMRDKYYETPFIAPIPQEINHICRLMTGYQLHKSRGIEDNDPTVEVAKKEANMLIKQILAGQILFDLPTAQRAL